MLRAKNARPTVPVFDIAENAEPAVAGADVRLATTSAFDKLTLSRGRCDARCESTNSRRAEGNLRLISSSRGRTMPSAARARVQREAEPEGVGRRVPICIGMAVS